MIGIGAAAGLSIIFAFFATKLLGIIGLTLAGGILLLWVCWKLWREIRSGHAHDEEEGHAALEDEAASQWRADQDAPPGAEPDRHR